MGEKKWDVVDLINGKIAAIKLIERRRQEYLFLQLLAAADDLRLLRDLHVAAQDDDIHQQKLRPPPVAVRTVRGDVAHLDPELRHAGKAHEDTGAGLLAPDHEGGARHHDEALQAPHEPEPTAQQEELVNRRDQEDAPRVTEGAEKEIRRHHDDERVEDGEREADEDLPEALSRERKEAVDTKKKADQK